MATDFNVGGTNANVNAKLINFSDGTIQITAGAVPPQIGIAVCTGSGPTITFASPYIATQAPIVIVTQIGTTPNGLGACVQILGGPGAWTGFTLHLSGTFFGAYGWVATGNPN